MSRSSWVGDDVLMKLEDTNYSTANLFNIQNKVYTEILLQTEQKLNCQTVKIKISVCGRREGRKRCLRKQERS